MLYSGTKTVDATPMTQQEYMVYRAIPVTDLTIPDEPGYLVEYMDGGKPNHPAHNGYISWSPKDVFERSYKPVEEPKYALPHQQRVYEEFRDLDLRIQALDVFIGGTVFTGLPHQDRGLLFDQDATMRKLRSILTCRIARF